MALVEPPVRLLLTGAIDYAGLFPPAGLDIEHAAKEYARYLDTDHAWMLGSFVAPAARLEELERLIPQRQQPWKVNALVGPGISEELTAIERFNRSGAGKVTWIEAKVSSAGQIRSVRGLAPLRFGLYFEVAEIALLDAVQAGASRAKIRTGGVTPDAFPAADILAPLIRAAFERRVPFKCTAGLHHALRGEYALTYQPYSPRATMHGFLNVLLAALFAQTAVSTEELIEILNARSPAVFGLQADGITWRHYRMTNQQIAQAREHGLVSFGSCSFTEPITELQSLGFL